jgi:hypothetical protein
MTNDYTVAIEEGATLIRVGTAFSANADGQSRKLGILPDSADRHLGDRTPSSGWEPIFQQIASGATSC